MHLPNHGMSVPVAVAMATVAVGAVVLAVRQIRREKTSLSPLAAGTTAALVFVLQMLNVTIPGASVSGHLIGAALAVALLGEAAGFLTMVAVITMQAFVFADGGVMALGGNIITMAVIPCLILSPQIQRLLPSVSARVRVVLLAAMTPIVGSLAVVGMVWLSHGGTHQFLSSMLGMHVLVGLSESLVSGLILLLVSGRQQVLKLVSLVGFAVVATEFSSSRPDILEWSLSRLFDTQRIAGSGEVVLHAVQSLQAIAPDYQFSGVSGPMLPALVGALCVGAVTRFLLIHVRRSSY